jgi:hypothetical protein
MRLSLVLALALAAFVLGGCARSAPQMERSAELAPAAGGNSAAKSEASDGSRAGGGGNAQTAVQDVSLQQADAFKSCSV